ncbi:hypothetical protein HMPREF0185_00799 [Brevundimonas diminuta 470-4]|nr:hypothetical protein HMPREF0185_00799 [Brevundimonas diminuta 470-4]
MREPLKAQAVYHPKVAQILVKLAIVGRADAMRGDRARPCHDLRRNDPCA